MYTLDNRLTALSKISQRKLVEILDKIPGTKDFIIDSSLIKPLERIVGVAKLRTHGIDKIYKLEKCSVSVINSQRVFLIPSDLITLKRVCDKINSEIRESNKSNSYHIIFVSRKLGCLLNLLEEEGICGYVSTYAFQWELLQLDVRVFSMEYPLLYRSLFVDGDQSSLSCIAKSIWSLHMLLGKPTVTILQGKHSHAVANMVDIFTEELGATERIDSSVSCFVVVDRDIDYASALLTGASYSSLLDEVFGIKTGIIDIKNKENSVAWNLNSSEVIYSQIKSRHFADVYPFLSSKIKEISLECSRSKNMGLHEMKRFVSNELQSLPATKKSLAYHIEACETIINKFGLKFEAIQNVEKDILEGRNRRDTIAYIEESLAIDTGDKRKALRSMCLMSLAQDGLLTDEASSLKNQFLHAYGFEHLPVFYRLEKVGLFSEQPSLIASEIKGGVIANRVAQVVTLPTRRSAFYSIAQKLKLFPDTNNEDYDLKNPKDLGYVFSGSYIPVVCQLIHFLIKQEIVLEEIVKMLPNCSLRAESSFKNAKSLRSFLVYFIGGVTYAEISAFQLLEKLTGVHIVVAGTSITNGNVLMESFF